MSEYVKLGAVSAAFYKARCAGRISPEAYGAAMLILSELEPETDVAPVRHARWDGVSPMVDTRQCSNGWTVKTPPNKTTPSCQGNTSYPKLDRQ